MGIWLLIHVGIEVKILKDAPAVLWGIIMGMSSVIERTRYIARLPSLDESTPSMIPVPWNQLVWIWNKWLPSAA